MERRLLSNAIVNRAVGGGADVEIICRGFVGTVQRNQGTEIHEISGTAGETGGLLQEIAVATNCGPGDLEILVGSHDAQDAEGGRGLSRVGASQPFSEVVGGIVIRISIWIGAG